MPLIFCDRFIEIYHWFISSAYSPFSDEVGFPLQRRLICFSLKKKVDERANYVELLQHTFIVQAEQTEVDVSGFVTDILDQFGVQR